MSLAAFNWTNRVRPVVELGVGSTTAVTGEARWDVAHWDKVTDRWAGSEPTWVDFSCDVRSVHLEAGRRRLTDRYVVAAATVVVDNGTGWADFTSPPVIGGVALRPGRAIRISVEHVTLGRRVLFYGFVDAMTPRYSPTDTDTVELSCIDALGEVNRAKLKPVAAPVGAGDSSSQRVDRILDAAEWITDKRDVWTSSLPLVATDLGGQVADLLGQAADSSGGAIFGDTAGRIAFRPRDWQTYVPDTPVDGTIGNVDPSDVCPVEWERPFERSDIATRAIFGRDLATAVVADDDAGQLLYGIEPFERVDLLTQNDTDLLTLANRVLRIRSAATAPRVRSVTLDARTSTAALDLMSTVDVYKPSRYRCRLQYPPPRGLVFDGSYFATAVAHDITPGVWSLDLNLDPSAPFEAQGGRWDRAYWDRATWTVAP